MLKTLSSKLVKLRKGIVGVGGNSKAGRDGKCELSSSEVDGIEVENNEVKKNGQKTSKSKNLSKFKKTKSDFLIFRIKMTFTKLRQAFIKASIFYYFDLERHIQIEMDTSGYAIGKVLSQLTLDDLG